MRTFGLLGVIGLCLLVKSSSAVEFGPKELLLPIREYRTLSEGFESNPNEPFIVHHPVEFSELQREEALRRLRASETIVFGYDDSGDYVEDLKIAELIRDW